MTWPKFKTKEQVPGDFLPMYEETGGEWQVKAEYSVKGSGGDPDEGAKKALRAERDLREQADAARKKAEDDLKEARTATKEAQALLLKAQREAEGKKVGKTSEELEELTQKIRDDVDRDKAAEIQGLKDEVESLSGVRSENRDLLLVQKVKEQFRASGVRKDKIDDLWELEKAEFELTEDRKPRPKNNPAKTVAIFTEDNLKKKRPDYFEGSKGDGGGSGGHLHGMPRGGITAEDVLRDPKAAINAARAARV